MVKFRFQDLEIWKLSIEIGDELFNIADGLEQRKYFRWAEQLRASGLSMSNNIAEGSGSSSDKDFARFLEFAKKSTFENANVLYVIHRRKLISENARDNLLEKLDHLCRKTMNFMKTLRA